MNTCRKLARRVLTLPLLCVLASCIGTPDARTAYGAGHFEDAYAAVRIKAERGDAGAQNALGVLFYVGVGIGRDFTQALYWFERAAIAGDAHARRHLGSMFRQGLGTNKDDFRAFGWYDAARTAGNSRALFYMQWMALAVGTNQQDLGRRLVAKDLKDGRVSHAAQSKGIGERAPERSVP